jgi:hypothetical protein
MGWVVCIMLQPHSIHRERTPGTNWIGDWVGLRAEISPLPLPGINTGRPICSQTLYWLSYPSFSKFCCCRVSGYCWLLVLQSGVSDLFWNPGDIAAHLTDVHLSTGTGSCNMNFKSQVAHLWWIWIQIALYWVVQYKIPCFFSNLDM